MDWKSDFRSTWEKTIGKDTLLSYRGIIESSIENLLEQEKKRMSDVEKVLERHASWKPTEGHSSEEELGFQKGLMVEAKLIKKEILAIINPTIEEIPQMKGTMEALDRLSIINK